MHHMMTGGPVKLVSTKMNVFWHVNTDKDSINLQVYSILCGYVFAPGEILRHVNRAGIAISCPKCIEHPSYSLWVLSVTDL